MQVQTTLGEETVAVVVTNPDGGEVSESSITVDRDSTQIRIGDVVLTASVTEWAVVVKGDVKALGGIR